MTNLHKLFTPDYAPYEIMKYGAYLDQGGYWRPIYSRILNKEIKNDYQKYDFDNINLNKLICKPDHTRNKYGVKCGLSLIEWEDNGWIDPIDPRGWFEWYCNYYNGRRIPNYDEWQINRWIGVKNRFGKRKIKNDVIKQILLQWAIDWNN